VFYISYFIFRVFLSILLNCKSVRLSYFNKRLLTYLIFKWIIGCLQRSCSTSLPSTITYWTFNCKSSLQFIYQDSRMWILTSVFCLTLKQHCLPSEAARTVFQAVVMAKSNYASPAWWGLKSTDDRSRLEAFCCCCAWFGYCNNTTAVVSMCDEADNDFSSK